MGSGSHLVRKVLVQFPNAFLNSPQFCAVQFFFEYSQSVSVSGAIPALWDRT